MNVHIWYKLVACMDGFKHYRQCAYGLRKKVGLRGCEFGLRI